MLGGDDGDMDVAMNAGTWYEGSTDWAPDAGHGTILAFVVLPWLSVTPTTGTVAAGDAQDLEVTFDASGLEPGTHRGAVFLRTSDPRRPTIEVDVTFVVHAFLRGVNAGGAAYVDTDGAEWSPDEQWLVLNEFGYLDPPTSVLTGGSSVVTTTEDIEGTDDDALFRSQRAGMGSYHVRVPRPGRYRVELGFAEIDGAAPGERVFNVVAESISPLLSSYDIVASAGGPMRADLHSFEIDLSDIWLDLHFEGITGDPVVNLLRVTSLD
jgi:hypothetical protein